MPLATVLSWMLLGHLCSVSVWLCWGRSLAKANGGSDRSNLVLDCANGWHQTSQLFWFWLLGDGCRQFTPAAEGCHVDTCSTDVARCGTWGWKKTVWCPVHTFTNNQQQLIQEWWSVDESKKDIVGSIQIPDSLIHPSFLEWLCDSNQDEWLQRSCRCPLCVVSLDCDCDINLRYTRS